MVVHEGELVVHEGECLGRTSSDLDVFTKTDPWYNIGGRKYPCNSSYPLCAKCLKRSEKLLIRLVNSEKFNKCDCNGIEIGVDPCFLFESCGCFCSLYNGASSSCLKE